MLELLFTLGVALLTTALSLGFIALMTMLRGFVLSKLWGWFMVPVFGLSPLSVVAGIGVALVVQFLVQYPLDYAKEADPKKSRTTIITGLSIPFVTLAFGYIVHLFL